jgi:hypothetical protein
MFGGHTNLQVERFAIFLGQINVFPICRVGKIWFNINFVKLNTSKVYNRYYKKIRLTPTLLSKKHG